MPPIVSAAAETAGALAPRWLARSSRHGLAVCVEPFRYLLFLRFIAVNGTGLVLLTAVWLQGWIDRILAADDTHICKTIFVLFVVGLVWAAQRTLMLSRELNALQQWPIGPPTRSTRLLYEMAGRGGHTRAALAGTLRLKLLHRIASVRHMASTLVLLGLIGTIVGFIIALSGVNQAAVTDAAAIGPMVATLLHGMAMALYKTLVGSVLNVWLMVNYRLLETGATHVLTRVVEIGERDAAA
ncbi:MAG: MotA/TolQ/ExbB proton channel family protein [Geminicoccaceae bacterium]